MAGKPLPLASRYDVDAETGCWNWKRGLSRGYPTSVQRTINGSVVAVTAYRFFYELINGPVPTGLDLDHLCRNRRCVNPDHLEPVTRAENIRRSRVAKLTPDNVVAIKALRHLGFSTKDIAQRFHVNQSSISRICTGKRWSA